MKEEINSQLVQRYDLIVQKLSSEEAKSFHLRSVENFLYHLIKKPSTDGTKFKKLQEINEVRMKKNLLEYLQKIDRRETDPEEAVENFNQYVYPVGLFMANHYGFSNSGGKTKYFGILLFLTFGVILDLFVGFLLELKIPVFTFSFLAIEIFRIYKKRKDKKVYGLYY